MENLALLQADAGRLPFRDESVDVIMAYSCFNHFEDPRVGVTEASRVLKKGGIICVWGFGTSSRLTAALFELTRKVFRLSKSPLWKKCVVNALVPSLLVFRPSSGVTPFRNSWEECCEIVSTNLSPDYVHLFVDTDWSVYFDERFEVIDSYKLECGQKFRKTG